MTVVAVMGCAALLMFVVSFLIKEPAARVLRYLALAEVIGLLVTVILFNSRPDWFKDRRSREDYD